MAINATCVHIALPRHAWATWSHRGTRISCLVIFVISSVAQGVYSQSQYRFQHYGTEEGLTHEALKMVQDVSGYLWILHPMGISRFDGYDFKYYPYNPGDSMSAPANNLSWHESQLLVDPFGQVCAITSFNNVYELSRYDATSDGFMKYPIAVEGDIGAVCFDKEKPILWFNAYPRGLASFDLETGKTRQFTNMEKDTLLDFRAGTPLEQRNAIYGINDQHTHLLLTTWNGLWQFDKSTQTFSRPTHAKDTSLLVNSHFLGATDESPGGNIWLTELISQRKIPNTSYALVKLKSDLSDAREFPLLGVVFTIDNAIDREGICWTASAEVGLFRCNIREGTVTNIQNKSEDRQSLPSNTLRDVMIDRDNNVWVVSEKGISRLRSEQVHLENLSVSGILDPFVTVYQHNGQERMLIGRWGKVTGSYDIHEILTTTMLPGRFDSLEFQSVKERVHGLGLVVWKGKDNLWFGTKNGGVSAFSIDPSSGAIKPGSLNYYNVETEEGNHKNLIRSNNTTGIWEDGQGNLWISTYGNGLNKVDFTIPYGSDGSVSYYVHNEDSASIGNNVVLGKFLKEAENSFWVTTASGVDLFRDGRFEHQFYNPWPTALLRISDNAFLVGTMNGLYEATRKEEGYHFVQVPFSHNVCAMQKDTNGRLWISDCEKLICYDPVRKVTIEFSSHEGFGHVANNLEQTSEGIMVMSDSHGITLFDPLSLKIDSIATHPVLTSLFVNNQRPPVWGSTTADNDFTIQADIGALDELILDYQHNNFSIGFSAMQMTAPEKNRFRHKLEYYDADWIETDWNSRTATYTNLNPGEYIFRVRASNYQGIWSGYEKTLIVHILPPPWKTWWAYSIYGLLILTGIFSGHKIQRNRLLQAEREKSLRKELTHAKEIEKAYGTLKATQAQLIQSEKMASLGELTAGIAHEIQNPLNFVNNFSEVNTELIAELDAEIEKGHYVEAREIVKDIGRNELKINHHGKRADGIVKGMLQHSRNSSGAKESTDINALADEYLRLAYHGMRAKDKSVNALMRTDFDKHIGNIKVIQQDIGRVMLNLMNNAFYAVTEKSKQHPNGFEPTVYVATRRLGNKIEIRVKDNGNGIPEKALDKIFQPFFTTKPTGHGTGLGLSISYDIVKAHGGRLKVDTDPGEGTEFTIEIPAAY